MRHRNEIFETQFGKQDAFKCFGGFQEIKINKKGMVKINKLNIPKKISENLKNLL